MAMPASVQAFRAYCARRTSLVATIPDKWIPFRADWSLNEAFDSSSECIQYAIAQALFPNVMIVQVGQEEWTKPVVIIPTTWSSAVDSTTTN